jgi:hypothetical protein
MSVYQVDKVCWRALHEPAFLEALREDADGTLSALPLTDEERDLLRRGEVGRLYEMGAHPYLLNHLPRLQVFGITPESYREKMRALIP